MSWDKTIKNITDLLDKVDNKIVNEIEMLVLHSSDFAYLKFEISQLPKTTIPSYGIEDFYSDREIRIMGVRIVGSDWIEKGKCKPFTHDEVKTMERLFNVNYKNEL